MLSLLIVQVLAAVVLVSIFVGFLLGHALPHPTRGTLHVVAKPTSGQWTEVIWVGGALVAAFWSIGVLLGPAYAYHWPALPDFPGSWAVQVLGFLVSMGGGLLFFSATRALGRYMTPQIQVREGHELIQEGPYRTIRHPVYTAIVTGAIGEAILYLSPVLALITLLLIGMARYRARLEEKLLSSPEAFGSAYADYQARTGRFLPRVWSKP